MVGPYDLYATVSGSSRGRIGSLDGDTTYSTPMRVVRWSYWSPGEKWQKSGFSVKAYAKSGWKFAGWTGNTSVLVDPKSPSLALNAAYITGSSSFVEDEATAAAFNGTITATFSEIIRTVTFNANGGEVSPATATGGAETAVTLPLPVRTGYTFLGWYTAASGGTLVGGSGNSYNPSKDITLYAHWNAISYTIAFDANGGTGSMVSVAATGGSQVTLPACTYTKTGSLFVGWNTAADGSGTAYADGATVINLTAEDGATVTLYAQWKTLHTITAAQVGGADVIDLSFDPSAATTIGEIAYWTYGTHVAVTATPRAGKLLDGGGISVNGVSQGGFTNDTPSEPYTFELVVTGDTVIVPVVSTQTFACTAAKDAASATAITSASVSSANVAYGGSVTFTAVLATGYSFAGWYDTEDNLVSSNAEYAVSNVTAPISLVAKAAASVSLFIGSAGQTHASLSVDGTVCENDSYSATLVVGTTISYELAIDSGWGLDAWKSGTTILPLGTSGTIYVDAAVNAEATIDENDNLQRTVTVKALNGATGETPLNIGDGFITFTEATAQQASSASDIDELVQAEEEPGNTCVGNFVGTRTTRATAQSTATINDTTLYFFGWYVDKVEENLDHTTTTIVAGELVSKALSLDILTNESKTYYVRYVESGTATVTVGTTNDSGELSGSVWIGDNEATVALENVPLGSDVTVHARARNGYRFDGWYDASNPTVFTPVSASETFTFTVYGETTYYARFVLDRNAICEWEGSNENKTMDWRSKVYVASKPFNPTSARVDADGYPVELAVGAWSSPDAAATSGRTAKILVRDQDARRLQMMRAERYLRIDVVSDSPVNAVFVGTSMEGLAV